MNKTRKFLLGLLVLLLVVSCPLLLSDPGVVLFRERSDPNVLFSAYLDRGAVVFNTDTIVDSLSQSDVDVFTLIDEASGKYNFDAPAQWKQADYLLIANGLHNFVWKETTNDWSLHDMTLVGDCSDQIGFDIVKISYHKLTGLQDYKAHMIGLYPRAGEGEWGGQEGFSRSAFDKWHSVDLEKLRVRAEDALALAEENGGKQVRSRLSNKCRIYMSLYSYPSPKWHISYTINPTHVLEMIIDAYSGEYEIPTP